ncbi:twin-arginine translocation signal domain-containing protein [Aliamphritea spongicola]|nr:twin-arginine translocation signal domain-containing protein [Aliamphritea spongicola]
MSIDKSKQTAEEHGKCMLTRRKFLMYSGTAAAASSVITLNMFPGTAMARDMQAEVTTYPRMLVAKLSELKDNQPVDFNYPDDGPNSQAMLVKMGVQGAAASVMIRTWLPSVICALIRVARCRTNTKWWMSTGCWGSARSICRPSICAVTALLFPARRMKACRRYCWRWTATTFMPLALWACCLAALTISWLVRGAHHDN